MVFKFIKKTLKKAAEIGKKAVQTIVPGGSKGFLEPKKKVEQRGAPVFKPTEKKEKATFEKRKAEPKEKKKGRGFVETLIKGPEVPEGAELKAGTVLIGPGKVFTGIKTLFGIGKVSKVAKAATPGKWIKPGDILVSTKVATNAKTIASSTNLLSKTIKVVGGAGLLVGAIGSYPFAGFIKEEAIQTIGFGTRSAIQSGNLDLAEESTAQIDEILDPSTTDKILAMIPYVNVVKQLSEFFNAARTKNEIDKRVISDLKIQRDTGETDDDKWARIKQEETDQDKAAVDYYNEQRKLMVEWEREAEVAARDADARFWRKEKEVQMKKEAEDREAIADFWIAYRKRIQELNEDSRPSNLNFGLL